MASNKSALTTDKIIASIKRRTMMPESSITFSKDDLIEFLNEEMSIGVIPSILQMKDEYLVYRDVVAIQSGVSIYPIPSRAIGNKLREVAYSDDSVNEYNMTQIELDNKISNNFLSQGGFYASQFYIQGSDIHLHPSNFNYSGYLFIYYYMRPNFLVQDNKVGVITAINRDTGVITLDNIPSNYASISSGITTIKSTEFDFVSADSPNKIIAWDIAGSVNAEEHTITLDDPSLVPISLKVGDYMPVAGETCVPNIPTELHPVLAQRVALRVLEALGDSAGLANAKVKLDEMEAKTGVLIDSRVEGSPVKIKNRQMQYTLRGRFMRGTF
jgi:hypothetical protein